MSITSEREQTIDFSYPFKESGLQILTKNQPGSSFAKIVAGLIKGDILWLLGGLLFVLLLNSHIIWLFERKKNSESFPHGYFSGYGKRSGGRSAPSSPAVAKIKRR